MREPLRKDATADRSARMQVRDFISGSFGAFTLQSPTQRLLLRPLLLSGARADAEATSRSAFFDGRGGIDALRLMAQEIPYETLIVDSAASAQAVAYEIERRDGVAAVVNEGRGVRFLSFGRVAPASELTISAPLIVDSSGRPSARARWAIEQTQGLQPTTRIRLVLDDANLKFPLAVLYCSGEAAMTWSASAAASRLVIGDSLTTNASTGFSGSVTDATTAAPVAFAYVDVYLSTGDYVDSALTDASGNYSIDVPAGSYRAFVAASGYVPQLYNGISCAASCDITSGTAITVVDGATTSNIGFALTSTTATIQGTVTDSFGSPLGDVGVVLYDSTGAPGLIAYSDIADGSYSITVRTGGTFYAGTRNTVYAGYVDKLYSGINCSGCNVTSGTPLSISLGSTHSSINFALAADGGLIAGKVSDAVSSKAVGGAEVDIYSAAGVLAAIGTADTGGNYVSFQGLATGSYYARASAPGYVSQLYDRTSCASGCSPTTGTAINVSVGATHNNVDFPLNSDQVRASGVVTDAATSAPLGDVLVLFYDSNGSIAKGQYTAGDGSYDIVLPGPGTYYGRVRNTTYDGYLDQVYSGIDCTVCSPTGGTALAIVSGTPALGVNFALHRGGSISGLVSDRTSGQPIVLASVEIYGSTGEVVTHGTTDTNGLFSSINGLASGNYYAAAYANGYVPQLYDDRNCGGTCVPTSGTLFHVSVGQNTPNIDFSLDTTTVRITGVVTAADTSAPLADVDVAMYDGSGNLVGSDSSAANGSYSVTLGAAGTYYALATPTPYPQYAPQLYDHKACDGCDPSTGTPIATTIGSTTTGINFVLASPACASFTITTNGLPGGTVTSTYNNTIAVSGGTAPITFAVTNGSLPAGVSLDSSTGALTGTLTSAGTYSFTIAATDATPCTTSHGYSVTVTASPTTTSLTASATTAVFGTPITLTASVVPAAATGTVSFFDGATLIGSFALLSGSATTTITPSAGAHNLSASYSGSGDYSASTSPTVQITVQRATPIITWPTPVPITYGTPLSSTQLNASANVAGTFVYSPPAGTILDAGLQTLSVVFTPADQNDYNQATASVNLQVNRADQTIIWSAPADIVYGTPLSSTQLNATVSVVGPAPAGALSYAPPAGTILSAGTRNLTVTAAATQDYNSATKTVTINVLKAVPAFSNLSAPTIIIGTPATILSGTISAGALIPTGTVRVTLAAGSQDVPIQADGTFSATFATSALAPFAPGYPITFTYAGDANFTAASASSLLVVTYGTNGLTLSSGPFNSGAAIPFRVTLLDASGTNVSSAALAVYAYGVQLVGTATWLPAPSTGNSGDDFQFQSGGFYTFRLKSTGLPAGSYVLGYAVTNDPVIHTIPFTIK